MCYPSPTPLYFTVLYSTLLSLIHHSSSHSVITPIINFYFPPFPSLHFVLKGLGGVVPNLDFLTSVDTSMLESMHAQMSVAAVQVSQYGDSAAATAASALQVVQDNEEQAKNAFSLVYAFIRNAEKGGQDWKPRLTGLVLTPAPIGKGRSAWVSPAGAPKFLEEGCDAIRKIKA